MPRAIIGKRKTLASARPMGGRARQSGLAATIKALDVSGSWQALVRGRKWKPKLPGVNPGPVAKITKQGVPNTRVQPAKKK